jgi:hypothetical protein
MEMYPVSLLGNSTRNDSPDLINLYPPETPGRGSSISLSKPGRV